MRTSSLDGASFGPEAVKAISQAFDAAWTSIEGNFGSDPAVREEARSQLAKCLLSVATEDSRDVDALSRGALEAIAIRYREPAVLGNASQAGSTTA